MHDVHNVSGPNAEPDTMATETPTDARVARLVIVQVDYQTDPSSPWTRTHAAVTADDPSLAEALVRLTAVPHASADDWDSQGDARTLIVASYPLNVILSPDA